MTPPPTPPVTQRVDVLEGRVRALEARYAQVVDRIDIYGPPPEPVRWPIPELSTEQRQTVALVLVALIVLTLRTVYAGRQVQP